MPITAAALTCVCRGSGASPAVVLTTAPAADAWRGTCELRRATATLLLGHKQTKHTSLNFGVFHFSYLNQTFLPSFQSLPCFWPLRAVQTSLCSWCHASWCHRWHHHLLNSDVVSGCNLIPVWWFSFHTEGFSKKTAGEPKNSLTKWYYFERVPIDWLPVVFLLRLCSRSLLISYCRALKQNCEETIRFDSRSFLSNTRAAKTFDVLQNASKVSESDKFINMLPSNKISQWAYWRAIEIVCHTTILVYPTKPN